MGNHEQVKAVIFDWAGTVVDFGSRAPIRAFIEVFHRFGVTVEAAEAREPMGLPKREHIRAVCRMPRIAQAWQGIHGKPCTDADVDRIYEVFVPLNADLVAQYSDPIPGALDDIASLRARGISIGSTTGYTRPIMDQLLPAAAAKGYAPDCVVCSDEVSSARPSPLMMYRCFLELGVFPAHTCAKVDDTAPGIAEGRAAGTWTVGVALSGNAVGLSREELLALLPDQLADARAGATKALKAAGADFVIDTVADLMPVIDEIGERLRNGERPGHPT